MDTTLPAETVRLQTRQPYDFGYALTYFTRRAGELVDRAEAGVYRRLFDLVEGSVLAEVQPVEGDALTLTVRLTEPGRSAPEQTAGLTAAISSILGRTLGLDDDLLDFRAAIAADPLLAGVVERFTGLRLISTPSAFEAFVWAVIGQQISLHVAFRLKAALVQCYGLHADSGGAPYWAFPTPERLAETNPEELAALGLGRRKAATIVSTAAAVAGDQLDLQALARLPLAEAEAALVALHGVGPWTAQYTLLRGLRVADACPVSDVGLRQACGLLYGLGRNATVEEVAGYADRWRPFRGYAAFYLWFMLSDARRATDG